MYQIKHTEAKLLLVHPSALTTALAAAKIAGLRKEHIFLFSDVDCGEIDGIRDWRSMLGTIELSQSWQWQHLTFEESKRRTAVINYSSGYCITTFLLINVEKITNETEQPVIPKASAFPTITLLPM